MIILLLENSCRIIEKGRKAGELSDQILPFFKKDLCASTGGFRPFDPGIIKLFSILLRVGYCLLVS